MSGRGKSCAYSIICAHPCSHSPEFEILIGLTQMDFNSSRLCLSALVIGNSRTYLVVPHWLTRC